MSWGEALYIRNILEKHIGIGASDVTLLVLNSERFKINKNKDGFGEVSSFIAGANGSIRLSLEYDSSVTLYVEVTDDAGEIQESYYTPETSASDWEIVTFDFNVKKGKKYIVAMKTSSTAQIGSQYGRNLKICGSVSDPTLIVKE